MWRDRRFDSHWAHNRPGYRCRHGRTSDRAEAPGSKSVYVREDHLLDSLRSRIPEIAVGDDEDAVDYLHANGLVIVYLGPGWILEQLEPDPMTTALPSGGTQLSLPGC